MDANDRKAIEDLFANLREVERRGQPRDPEAEAFIRERIAAQPSAPYYLAQTVVVQKQALEAAERRLAAFEGASAPSAGKGDTFDSLFGGDDRPASSRVPSIGPERTQRRPGDGPGFLAGAAQTAVGVAGGILLGSMIGGLFRSDEAKASEPQAEERSNDAADTQDAELEPAADDGGSDFFDMGDLGDFEI